MTPSCSNCRHAKDLNRYGVPAIRCRAHRLSTVLIDSKRCVEKGLEDKWDLAMNAEERGILQLLAGGPMPAWEIASRFMDTHNSSMLDFSFAAQKVKSAGYVTVDPDNGVWTLTTKK